MPAVAGCTRTETSPVRITSVRRGNLDGAVRVQGTVLNESERTISDIVVTVRFFSGEEEVGTEETTIPELGPGRAAQFAIEFEADPESVDDYRASVTAD